MRNDWKVKSALAVLSGALLIAPTQAEAQHKRDISIGITGGFSNGPQGPYSSAHIGYNMAGTVEVSTPIDALKLRGEAMYSDWTSHSVKALIGNVLLTPLPSKSIVPYALAGGGFYQSGGSSGAGWTLGLGLRLPTKEHTVFVESRMHAFQPTWTDANNPPAVTKEWQYLYTPISLGFQF